MRGGRRMRAAAPLAEAAALANARVDSSHKNNKAQGVGYEDGRHATALTENRVARRGATRDASEGTVPEPLYTPDAPPTSRSTSVQPVATSATAPESGDVERRSPHSTKSGKSCAVHPCLSLIHTRFTQIVDEAPVITVAACVSRLASKQAYE